MYARLLTAPQSSALLLGPRGTGKSTWIQEHFPGTHTYDLLNSREALRFERDPHLLSDETRYLDADSWVVIDEVQKVPSLLDEVHRLIETRSLRFLLCGSSARKLRRGGANLLAGRAASLSMLPLVSAELGPDFRIQSSLVHGTLPLSIVGADPIEFLSAYAQTYVNEEIRAEALTRNVGGFSRFLEVAARQNGQITNAANIAREAGVARTTVQTYFDILVDTLLGYWIPAWELKSSNRGYSHPKFYLFDTGVARALSGRLPYPPTLEESGALMETLVFNELRAYLAYRNLYYRPHYWRTYDGTEVDLLCETVSGYIAVEIKSTTSWQGRFSRGLSRVADALSPRPVSGYGVYLGERETSSFEFPVFPLRAFLDRLWAGHIL